MIRVVTALLATIAACATVIAQPLEVGDPIPSKPAEPLAPPSPPGEAEAWEGQGTVSDFSWINVRTGNLLTRIDVFAFDPVGPEVRFELFQNSGVNVTASNHPGSVIPLWSHTYSGRVQSSSGKATVIEDDGARRVYTLIGGRYHPPAGVHEALTFDNMSAQWRLVRRNGEARVFDSTGRLVRVEDSSGNAVVIERPNADTWMIRSAADTGQLTHRLVLTLQQGRLQSIEDPTQRRRYFVYGSDGRLQRVTPGQGVLPGAPTGPRDIAFKYDSQKRLASLDFRGLYVTEHAFSGTGVTIRSLPVGQGTILKRRFEVHRTQGHGPLPPVDPSTKYWTLYTDRHERVWRYEFDVQDNLRAIVDPDGWRQRWQYDAGRNRVLFENELGDTWLASFGPVGTLLKLTTPLGYEWTMEYAPVGNPATTNVYRLTRTTDPEGNWVAFHYNELFDPLLVSVIEECPDGQGNPAASTTLEYFGPETPAARGMVKRVTDAGGVGTEYGYDQYGYQNRLIEGTEPGRMAVVPREDGTTNSPGGLPVSAIHDAGEDPEQRYDDDGNPTFCVYERMRDRGVLPPRLGSVPSPQFEDPSMCSGDVDRDTFGRLIREDGCTPGGNRWLALGYDEHGQIASRTLGSSESGATIVREVLYSERDPEGEVLNRTGPDGLTSTYQYDIVGRLLHMTTGDSWVTLTYDPAGNLTQTRWSNGTSEAREYDSDGRLISVMSTGPGEQLLAVVYYTWSPRNLVVARVDIDLVRATYADSAFDYDARGKLIGETRNGPDPYSLSYTYDNAGNRMGKVDHGQGRSTVYFYDTEEANRDPAFPTNHNRLLRYDEYVGSVVVRTVRYVYYKTGHVSNIIVKDAGDSSYRGLALTYTRGGLLWLALWDRWQDDGHGGFTGYERLAAREFRADGLDRYLTRDLDPATLAPLAPGGTWTDHDFSGPVADYSAEQGLLTPHGGYALGGALETKPDGSVSQVSHADMTGTATVTTDDSGQATSPAAVPVTTAFGERVNTAAPPTRYGYGGRFGYESSLLTLPGAAGTRPLTFIRTGARWYQPEIGRYIQRDPIGIRGDLNVYMYARNNPMTLVDPDGTSPQSVSAAKTPKIQGLPSPLRQHIKSLLPKYVGGNGTTILGKGVGGTLARIGATRAGTFLFGYCMPIAGAAATGYQVGSAIADNTGIDEWIGDKLGRLCPSCWDWVWW